MMLIIVDFDVLNSVPVTTNDQMFENCCPGNPQTSKYLKILPWKSTLNNLIYNLNLVSTCRKWN